MPLYLAVRRGPMVIHLSEHYGDAAPGATLFIRMTGIDAFNKELLDKRHGFARPGIETMDWGRQMTLNDPFGSRLRFCEQPD